MEQNRFIHMKCKIGISFSHEIVIFHDSSNVQIEVSYSTIFQHDRFAKISRRFNLPCFIWKNNLDFWLTEKMSNKMTKINILSRIRQTWKNAYKVGRLSRLFFFTFPLFSGLKYFFYFSPIFRLEDYSDYFFFAFTLFSLRKKKSFFKTYLVAWRLPLDIIVQT